MLYKYLIVVLRSSLFTRKFIKITIECYFKQVAMKELQIKLRKYITRD